MKARNSTLGSIPTRSRLLSSLVAASVLLVTMATAAVADDHDLLLSVAALREAQAAPSSKVLLLQVDRSDALFEKGHIPGAGYLPYNELVTNKPVEGGTLIVEFPPTEKLTEVFRAAGIDNDAHVVLYGHPIFAARAFLTLEQMGHDKISLLDGGLEAWTASGGEAATGPVGDVDAGDFEAKPRTDILVDAKWVDEHRSDDDFAVIDARPLNEFTGADGGMGGRYKAGHIPGASHLYWEELVQTSGPDKGRFLGKSGLEQRFATAGLDGDDTMVSYCFIGMRASVNYFLARVLGHDAKFYDGSWNDWSLNDLEAEVGPDPTAPFSEAARRDENGWVILFDGFTMNGWQANENTATWTVEDGALTCLGPRSHLFYVGGDGEEDNTFTDFEFSAEVRTTKGSNSGIYFHTRYQDGGWPKYGYEAQVNQTHLDPKKTGSLYDVVNVMEQLAKDDEWYTQTIRVEGRKVTISVNGEVAVEYEEPEGKKRHSKDFERLLDSGTFAFQAHDPKSKAQFRNIKVRRF